MPNKLMMVFFGADFLFACCGGLLIGFSLMAESAMRASPTTSNVAQQLLLRQCPLTGRQIPSCSQYSPTYEMFSYAHHSNQSVHLGGVVNAIFVFITFL